MLFALLHADDAAAFGVDGIVHFIHKGAHIEYAPSAGVEQVIGAGRVGQLRGIEAGSVVADNDGQRILLGFKPDIYLLIVGALVTVGNGVNDRFVNGQFDPTGVVFAEAHFRRDTLGDRSNQIDEFEFAVY